MSTGLTQCCSEGTPLEELLEAGFAAHPDAHFYLFFHSPWVSSYCPEATAWPPDLRIPRQHWKPSEPTGRRCLLCARRDGEALPQMGGVCFAKYCGCKLFFVACMTFCLSFCRESRAFKHSNKTTRATHILAANFNGKCKWLLQPTWELIKARCLHEEHWAASQWSLEGASHWGDTHEFNMTTFCPVFWHYLPRKWDFTTKLLLIWRKSLPILCALEVMASQHKLGKEQLVKWEKEEPGNKLVSHYCKWKAA